jgi:hypothetical protein
MSEDHDDGTIQEPADSTAPPHSRWRALPSHLGRARTSTLVLSALFLTIGALYLNVRPDVVAPTTPAGGGSVVEEPLAPRTTAPTAPMTTVPAPPTTTAPTTTAPTITEPRTTAPRTTERTGTSTSEEPAPGAPTSTELTAPVPGATTGSASP